MPTDDSPDKMRLDKWLWAARFFKTRALATDAVDGGRVKLNGQRTKPAHALRVGDRLSISIGEHTWDISVLQLSAQRGPATTARTLYAEDSDSHARRQQQVAERRELGQPHPQRAPQKHDRRALAHLKRNQH